jgi:hypothetical protein
VSLSPSLGLSLCLSGSLCVVCQRGGGWGPLHDPQGLCAELPVVAHAAPVQPQDGEPPGGRGRHHQRRVSSEHPWDSTWKHTYIDLLPDNMLLHPQWTQ